MPLEELLKMYGYKDESSKQDITTDEASDNVDVQKAESENENKAKDAQEKVKYCNLNCLLGHQATA